MLQIWLRNLKLVSLQPAEKKQASSSQIIGILKLRLSSFLKEK
jgi:hypothetical protein